MWILTREINEYDQDGAYFEKAWVEKPTYTQLYNAIKKYYEVDKIGSSLMKHIMNGGGRLDVEHTWFFLSEVKQMKNEKKQREMENKVLMLMALEQAGVDNWSGYDEAIDIFERLRSAADKKREETNVRS